LREVDADLRILDLPDSTEYRTKRTQLYEELLCSRSLGSSKQPNLLKIRNGPYGGWQGIAIENVGRTSRNILESVMGGSRPK
jgi:hypothetical protein